MGQGPGMKETMYLSRPINVSAALVAGCLWLVFATGQAAALERRVVIVNDTSFDLIEFYGSNVGSDSWEEDILGQNILPAGASFIVNFDDGSGYCMFDFMGIFEDGDEVIKRRVNVCRIRSIHFASD